MCWNLRRPPKQVLREFVLGLYRKYRFDVAMSMAQEAPEWFQEARHTEGQGRALHFMAQFHADQGEYANAIDKLKEEFGHRLLDAGAFRVLCELHPKFRLFMVIASPCLCFSRPW